VVSPCVLPRGGRPVLRISPPAQGMGCLLARSAQVQATPAPSAMPFARHAPPVLALRRPACLAAGTRFPADLPPPAQVPSVRQAVAATEHRRAEGVPTLHRVLARGAHFLG
jgi:hypothetical protein